MNRIRYNKNTDGTWTTKPITGSNKEYIVNVNTNDLSFVIVDVKAVIAVFEAKALTLADLKKQVRSALTNLGVVFTKENRKYTKKQVLAEVA